MNGILASYLRAIGHLFFPSLCYICHRLLTNGEDYLCTHCRVNMPISSLSYDSDRKLYERFQDIPPQSVFALFRYHKTSIYNQIIYQIKYEHKKEFAYYMGTFLGYHLQRIGTWDGITFVPLHPKRQQKRGYNQAEYIARGVSDVLHIPCYTNLLIRLSNNHSQTHKSSGERMDKTKVQFALYNVPVLTGKSILLIDDVITSGTTMYGCAKALSVIRDLRLTLAALGRTVSA